MFLSNCLKRSLAIGLVALGLGSATAFADPDGIAVSVIDAPAIESAVRKAIDQGIPVMAFNTADPRSASACIPYLAYVGTNSYLDGRRAAEHALAEAKAGRTPMPTGVLCINPFRVHAGLAKRCRGMADGMGEELIQTATLVTDPDPTRAAEILGDYLERLEQQGTSITSMS